jgi:class 3 adenylate cyclase/pimeloyl-ACP methyl ester carboxylesterase
MAAAPGQTLGAVMIPETRYAKTLDGFHIAYQTIGPGPTDLVLLRRYFWHLEHYWKAPWAMEEIRAFTKLGRVILFDGRGTGLSDSLRGTRLPTMEERSDDLRAVMDAVSSERVVLVSFADSGPLCCLFAATFPERTRALILNNASPRTAWAPDYPWGMTHEEFEAELEATETRWGSREYATEMYRDMMPGRPDDDELIEWMAALMPLSASPAAAAALLRMFYEMDVRDVLPAIHVPTLVLAGDATAEEGAALADLIPGAAFWHLDTPAGLVMQDPQPFYEAIHRFVVQLSEEEADLDRVLQTVLFTDIVGSSEKVAGLGDRAWRDLLERHHRFIRGVLARWRGREIDTAGDGFFAVFDGPARAVRCAKAIVEGVRSMGIEVRVGLHAGECEIADGKVAGITVVIGSRIASFAGPSEVLVSRTVRDLVAGSGLAFHDRGELELKGVPDPWQVYSVI